MKMTIFTLLLCVSASMPTFAQESDHNQPKKIGSYYLDGVATTYFERIIKSDPKQNRKRKISFISIPRSTGNAKLETENPTFTFIDYMNLLKIDCEWKVINRMYYLKLKTSSK